MATRTVSAAGGNWSSTTTWAEGVVPTAADDVVANASSGNLTISAAAVSRSFDGTLYAGTLTHNAGVTWTIGDATAGANNIALKFSASMTYVIGDPITSAIVFGSTATTQQTVDFAGKVVGNITFGSSGTPNYATVSGLNAGATTTITSNFGHLYLDGPTSDYGLQHTIGKFVASASNVRTIALGNSTLTFNGTGTYWNMGLSNNITFLCGTSTIIHSDLGAAATGAVGFSSGGKTYYRIRLIGAPEKSIGTGTNVTCTVAFYERIGPYTNEYGHISAPMPGTGTLKVTNTFKAWGDGESHRLMLWPNNNAIVANLDLTGATIDVKYLTVQDINFIRGADLDLSAITGFSSDAGGNTIAGGFNLIFTPAVTQDWIASGSGNWSNPANWSSGRVPLCQDPVNITKAFTGSPTISMDCCFSCGPLDMSASTGNVTMTVANVLNANMINGFVGRAGVSMSGSLYWNARGGTRNFTFGGATVAGTQSVSSANGGLLNFVDSGTFGSSIAHRSGMINIPTGVNIATGSYLSTATTLPAISGIQGGGTLTLNSTGTVFSAQSATLSDYSKLGRIHVSNTSSTAKTFAGNGNVFNNLTFAGGTGALTITGANSFRRLPRNLGSVAGVVTFPAATTTTWTGAGDDSTDNGTNVTTYKSATAGSATIFAKASGRIRGDYLSIQDVSMTGAAPFFAGANSTNVSGNSGITFAAAPSWNYQAMF